MSVNEQVKSVLLSSRIDGQAATDLKLSLTQMLNSGIRKILCNFSRVEFISPMGAEELAKVARLAAKVRGEVGICQIKDQFKDLFRKLNLMQLFRFYNVEESILLMVLKVLIVYFDEYENVLDIRARLDGAIVNIEIFLTFDGDQKMRHIQQTIDCIKHDIEQNIKNSCVLIVAGAQPDIVQDNNNNLNNEM